MNAHQHAQEIVTTLDALLTENSAEHFAFIRPSHHEIMQKALSSLNRRLGNGEFSRNGVEQFQHGDYSPRV